MARRPSKHLRAARPLSLSAGQTSDTKADGRWVTRPITTQRATKDYTCPGCGQTIAAGVAHLVAWPATPPIGSSSGLEHRRHWHTACWRRRP